MQQQYTNTIKDGFVTSFLTVVATGALITLAPNFARTLLAVGTSTFGIAAATSYQQNRLKKQLRLDIDDLLHQESIEIQQSIALLRESISDNDDTPLNPNDFFQEDVAHDGVSVVPEASEHPEELSSLEEQPLSLTDSTQETDSRTPIIDTQAVVDWLHHQKIGLDNHTVDNSPTAQVLGRLALYLGNHYSELKPLHQELKRHIATGSRFKISLAGKSQRQTQICTQFCNQLDKLSLLSYYRYSRQEKIIYAATQKRPDIDEFFRGGWFERYVAQTVEQYLQEQKLEYQYLLNPKIIFESGDRFELDLLFLVEGQPLWIECKATRDFNRYLKQYSHHREQLGIDKQRSLLVALDLQSHQAKVMTDMWGITVTHQHDLITKMSPVLEAKSPELMAVENNVSPLFGQNLSKFLRQKRIYPLPQKRLTVLHEFIQVVSASDAPLTLREIKERLALVFQDNVQVSKTKLQSILRTILRTRCLQGVNGDVIVNFNTPIHQLASVDVEWLDQQCVYQYVAIALAYNPSYFSDPENCQAFELAVGRKAPSAETIQKIRDSAA